MNFQTEQLDDGTVMIKRQNGDILAGSICRIDDHWHVEILWSGPTGDIVFDAPSLPAALAFVAGVSETFKAIEQTNESTRTIFRLDGKANED